MDQKIDMPKRGKKQNFAHFAVTFITLIAVVSCSEKKTSALTVGQDAEIQSLENGLNVDQFHGYEHIDTLQFLEERNDTGQPNEKTQSIIDKYNEKSKTFFSQDESLLESIYQEILSRRPKDVEIPHYTSRGISFSETIPEGEKFPTIYYEVIGTAKKKVLINQSKRSKGQIDYSLNGYALSPDNKLMAWSESTSKGSLTTLYVTPIGQSESVIHKIENAAPSIVWGDQSKRLYYSLVDPSDNRFFQIRMYNLETEKDIEIYTEKDSEFLTIVSPSPGSNGLFIDNFNWSIHEALYIDFNKSYTNHELVVGRKNEITFGLGRYGEKYVISYQYDQETSRISSFSQPNSEMNSWKNLYSTSASIASFELTSDYFVFIERAEGADTVKSFHVPSSKTNIVDISSDRYGARFVKGNHNLDENIVRISFDSYLSNTAIVDADLNAKATTKSYSSSIPNFDPDQYIVQFEYVKSHDKVLVPVTIIKRKDTNLPAPAYQYVYGSYGYGLTPKLPWFALSLIDRGFVFVISHVRGGNELGEQWHKGGKLLNRKNTFQDFQFISKYLIEKGYTTEGDISISGESAAGTILGVAVNEKPHLYKSLTSLVPALDIFNKLLNPNLMVTKTAWSEFGNPMESKEVYEYIRSYSPLENLTNQDYPDYYITARLNDRNVDFFEPLKWAIKVDHADTNVGLNLIEIDDGGHIRTGYGGKEYDFAKQMYFILKTHQK